MSGRQKVIHRDDLLQTRILVAVDKEVESPPLCHSQLLVMVAMMAEITPGQLIQDPMKSISVLQHVINWVDNTMNKEILDRNANVQEQIVQISDILVHWRRILQITGGDLELSKTIVYYLDHFQEDNGRVRYKTIEELPGEIRMPKETPNDKERNITQNEPSTAKRYLVVRVAPNGQMETEFNFRFSQAKKMAKAIAKIQMTRSESTIAYQSRWLSVVEFFPPITYFCRKRCEQIQVPISGISTQNGLQLTTSSGN